MTGLQGRIEHAVRTGTEDALAALCTDDVTVSVDVRPADLAALSLLLGGLDAPQRAGLVVTAGTERTVVVAPSPVGSPARRKLFLFTHPTGEVSAISAYTDDTDPLPDLSAPATDAASIDAAAGLPGPVAGVVPRVLVTASSDTLGAVIAQGFADSGIATAWQGTRASGPGGIYIAGDLTRDPEDVVLRASEALGGPITVLVHNLGPWDATPVAAATPAAWNTAIDVHATAMVRMAQLVAPGMRESGWGRIVAVSASSARTRDHGLYGLGKAILEQITETLAFELAPEITVNAIAPGQIAESVQVMAELDPAAVPRMLRRTPAGRFVTRAEVAALVRTMCGPAFDMVTGAVIPLDGGYRIPRN